MIFLYSKHVNLPSNIWNNHTDANETIQAINNAIELYKKSDFSLDIANILGEGWVGEEALSIGIYSALIGKDFKDVLRISANHNGDSDSTATLTGQIIALTKGLDCIPFNWQNSIELKDTISHLANEINLINED